MSEQIIILARFRFKPGSAHRDIFKQHLLALFDTLAKEPAFVSAILHESFDHPDEFLIYEIWHEGREQFLREEMTKSYRQSFERLLDEFGIERSIDWLTPVAAWGSSLKMVRGL